MAFIAWVILGIVIARLGITAKVEWVVTGLERERACKISNVLLLKSEKDKRKEKRLLLISD